MYYGISRERWKKIKEFKIFLQKSFTVPYCLVWLKIVSNKNFIVRMQFINLLTKFLKTLFRNVLIRWYFELGTLDFMLHFSFNYSYFAIEYFQCVWFFISYFIGGAEKNVQLFDGEDFRKRSGWICCCFYDRFFREGKLRFIKTTLNYQNTIKSSNVDCKWK